MGADSRARFSAAASCSPSGGLAWGIPLLVASGGLNTYLAALGSQAGEDFAAGEMLYTNPNPRALAFALLRTFVHPWDSTALGTAVLILAAAGIVQLLWRDRRSLAAVFALAGPYVVFHLLFQDTSFIRYALPLVPVVAFLAVRGVSLVSVKAVPAVAALVSIACVAIASPVLVAYRAEPSPGRQGGPRDADRRNIGTARRAGHAPDVCPAARGGGGRH